MRAAPMATDTPQPSAKKAKVDSGDTIDCVDGNTAACHVAYAMSEACFIYPITPSSSMAELADVWSTQEKRNNVVSNTPTNVTQMQSEGGAAGALHGAASAGALVSTFTASQGLLLMVPVMYKIAGEMLPVVFHVAARQVGSNANSIFGEHGDVMACRATGVCILSSSSVQEVMDLACAAHVAAIRGSLPVLHFFDGFQLSHEIRKIDMIRYETMGTIMQSLKPNLAEFRSRSTHPMHPNMRNMLHGRDTLFQAVEANNKYWNDFPSVMEKALRDVAQACHREKACELFEYQGAADAQYIIVIMGASARTVSECTSYLCNKGEKVGFVVVHLFRPWSLSHFAASLPPTVRAIAVLDRCREPGSLGEPLYQDVSTSILRLGRQIRVVGGRYALGDKPFTPTMCQAVFKRAALVAEANPDHLVPLLNTFTVGINDDVTHLSLPLGPEISTTPTGTRQCIFWGMGSDGTVGANRLAISLIGKHTSLDTQGNFFFTAHKAGGVTTSHLRFSPQPITSSYPIISDADYIACHQQSYLTKFPNMLRPLKSGGTFVINCSWCADSVSQFIPPSFRRLIAQKRAKLFIINANKISRECGLGGHINLIMQVCFFHLSQVMNSVEAIGLLKQSVEQAYHKKGEDVVRKNHEAIDNSISGLLEISYPSSWEVSPETLAPVALAPLLLSNSSFDIGDTQWMQSVKLRVDAMDGHELPVSVFAPSGSCPTSSTRHEKRGIATQIPLWNPAACVQCATCSIVCPHSAIRTLLLTHQEVTSAANHVASVLAVSDPPQFECVPARGINAAEPIMFRVLVSPQDCTGCGVCFNACPCGERGALKMSYLEAPTTQNLAKTLTLLWDHCITKGGVREKLSSIQTIPPRSTVKGSQLLPHLFEFSGACAGCPESSYLRLLCMLFGERLCVGNTAGCSSAISLCFGSCPYTKSTTTGWGPAVSVSLFENGAEYALGIKEGHDVLRTKLYERVSHVLQSEHESLPPDLKVAFSKWVDEFNDSANTVINTQAVIQALTPHHTSTPSLNAIWEERDAFMKISHWAVGGDGWAYDIDFGGLDHVLSLGQDLKVLILDTELYSNTGGQKSKGSAKGSVSKFASGGYSQNKKDFASIVMGYENAYVAQVALYANPAQTLKAFLEAESFPGPAVIIAYCPCIEHGIEGDWVSQTRLAVATGYWPLFRYNPRAPGSHLQVDSPPPSKPVKEFLQHENRFLRLTRENPTVAESLQAELIANVERKVAMLQQLANKRT
ncbi:pyruvate:ferredoxin oxidoreductase [Pelomyxa schiedti]|nr:pyruvate:ferredoxin oxidoreductase [Pelomyxa schiedti]